MGIARPGGVEKSDVVLTCKSDFCGYLEVISQMPSLQWGMAEPLRTPLVISGASVGTAQVWLVEDPHVTPHPMVTLCSAHGTGHRALSLLVLLNREGPE